MESRDTVELAVSCSYNIIYRKGPIATTASSGKGFFTMPWWRNISCCQIVVGHMWHNFVLLATALSEIKKITKEKSRKKERQYSSSGLFNPILEVLGEISVCYFAGYVHTLFTFAQQNPFEIKVAKNK